MQTSVTVFYSGMYAYILGRLGMFDMPPTICYLGFVYSGILGLIF